MKVNGRCPACGSSTLFVGKGGWLTCSWIDCPEPSAPGYALHDTPGTFGDLVRTLWLWYDKQKASV